ncbi:MAG: serine hydrolase [Bacteroidota bacterium]
MKPLTSQLSQAIGMVVLLLTFVLGLLNSSFAQNKMQDWQWRHNMTSATYNKIVNDNAKAGYTLRYVDGYTVNGKVRFAAIWTKGLNSTITARHGLSGSQYQTLYQDMKKKGFRLIHIDGYNQGGKATYAAIWKKMSSSGIRASHGLTSSQYQAAAEKNLKDGYKLIHVSGYGLGSKDYYAAIWKKSSPAGQILRHGMTSAVYQQEFNKNHKKGYKLVHVDSYDVKGKVYYAAIWEKVRGWYVGRHGMTPHNHQAESENMYYRGFVPVAISGHDAGSTAGYAAAYKNILGWKKSEINKLDQRINSIMKSKGLPGVSIAIVKDEKLVYARGYGYGNVEKKELVSPMSQFRTASVSKRITQAGIQKLTETTNLKKGSKVFGTGAVLGTQYGSKAYGTREKQITVKNLLEHKAGGNAWDHNTKPHPENGPEDKWGAPMFQQLSKNKKELIGWVLDTRNPSEPVGSLYAYSNFSYCVLGRVIEEKAPSGEYEKYIKNKILKPSGISTMKIGSSSQKGRASREVIYYGGSPYSLLMRRMDSHGGWIATSVDLMKFAVRVDGKSGKKDVIKDGININHFGGMSGTSAGMINMGGGIYYSFLVNKSGSKTNNALSDAIKESINLIKTWPQTDLF